VKDEYKSPYWRGLVWRFIRRKFHFINGGTVYRMENIRRMSKVQEYASERHFATVAKNMEYTLVFPRRPEEQRPPVSGSPGYFTHVGGGESTQRKPLCRGVSYT
jgi:hypothetical protein